MAVLVERDNIGIFGKMNAGKSTVMNLLTQQETSIVDKTPGTTADTKIALAEIHGIGPVKIYDTAGLDEYGELGHKKRKKIFSDLKECDLALIVIDPSVDNFEAEIELLNKAREYDKQVMIIYNLFNPDDKSKISCVEKKVQLLKFYKKIILSANNESFRDELINFILDNFESKNHKMELLPFIEKDEYYILIIPMDEETPPGRYLRPQAMVEEYITRKWGYPVSFRLDLSKARSKDIKVVENEKNRFISLIKNFSKKPRAIITDSQAIDVMNQWCPNDILLTTFSIIMINYVSRGRLNSFANGIKKLDELKKGDKILIVEACNHSRIAEDIGTVQIPNYLEKNYPGILIEHNFGREFHDNEKLENYNLIIHCGGCMISSQKLFARIRDLDNLGIPYTNYGLFLSYIQGNKVLDKVLEPWNLKFDS